MGLVECRSTSLDNTLDCKHGLLFEKIIYGQPHIDTPN